MHVPISIDGEMTVSVCVCVCDCVVLSALIIQACLCESLPVRKKEAKYHRAAAHTLKQSSPREMQCKGIHSKSRKSRESAVERRPLWKDTIDRENEDFDLFSGIITF